MTAVGTPLYCAPEVLNGEVYDEKVREIFYYTIALN